MVALQEIERPPSYVLTMRRAGVAKTKGYFYPKFYYLWAQLINPIKPLSA